MQSSSALFFLLLSFSILLILRGEEDAEEEDPDDYHDVEVEGNHLHLDNQEERFKKVHPGDFGWEDAKVVFIRLNKPTNIDSHHPDDDDPDLELQIEVTRGGSSQPNKSKPTILRLELSPVSQPPPTVIVRHGEDFLYHESPEEEGDPSQPCHWRGRLVGELKGQAVLSTCNHPHHVSGTLITDQGVWFIQPDENANEESTRGGKGRRTRREIIALLEKSHLVMGPSSADYYLNTVAGIVDVVKVPLRELEAAAKLAKTEAKKREVNESDVDYEDDMHSFAVPLTDYSVVKEATNGSSSSSPLRHDPYSYYTAFIPRWLWTHPHSNNPMRENLSFPLPKKPAAARLIERRSRESDKGKKWVEMAIFTDEELYERFKKKYPNDTVSKIKDYTTTMIHTMDLLYGDKSLGVSIGYRLVHLEIMRKSPKDLDTNGGKAKAYLASFCDYAGQQNVDSGLWDHALLLTGIDLHEQGLKSTAGLAWAGTMCYKYYSCSVAEGYSFGTAFIVTHEMGHSLGMEHDGVGISGTCDKEKYIMSPTTGAGKVTWSPCSGKNLQDFIMYGTSELRAKKYELDQNLLSKPACLSEIVAKGRTGKANGGGKLPGESYDAYFQCSMGLGATFKPYFQRSRTPFNNICWMLYCGNGTHAVSTHPALEGTKCDRDKYCRRGECIKRP